MRRGSRWGSTARSVALAGLAGALLGGALVGFLLYAADRNAPVQVRAFVSTYDNQLLTDPFEIRIVQSDGQAFAQLARDPSLSRPEVFPTAGEASYRAQRPLLPYLAWATSAGQPGWVPPALATWTIVGIGAAVAGLGALLRARGASPWFALLLLLLPGVYSSAEYFGPESLVLALQAWGLVAWTGSTPRRGLAALLFTLAGLGRETALVVPGVLGLHALLSRRVADAARLAIPFAVYGAWILFLRLRVGAWPTSGMQDDRLALPLVGLVQAARRWSDPADQAVYVLLAYAVAIACVVWRRHDPLTAVVVGYAAVATLFGQAVWDDWAFFTRALLPLYAFGLVALIGGFSPPGGREAEGSSQPGRTRAPGSGSLGAAPAPPSS